MPVTREDKTPKPVRAPGLRTDDFEGERCLRCQDPDCVEGCPVQLPIPDLMQAVAAGDMREASEILRTANPLAAICSRICPQELHCEMHCQVTRRLGPVAIGDIERQVSDWEMAQAVSEEVAEPWRDEKIAIIGSGPSGLVCAGELARLGYPVTVYEALPAPGGILRYGIPEFRLPKAILDWEIAALERLGVEFANNVTIGLDIEMDGLMSEMGYSAVFIGTGAGQPKFIGVPGETLNGVHSANEFLTRINLLQAFEDPGAEASSEVGNCMAVIGCDYTALDAVRSALRLGAERAMLVCRSGESEMAFRPEEYEHAMEEGVEFHWLTRPVEIVGEDGRVTGLKCVRMKPGEAEESGRTHPTPVEGSDLVFPVDSVLLSIGTRPNTLLKQTAPGRHQRIYAGGDAVTGGATVIQAAGAGKRAAAAIHSDLMNDAS